MTVLGQSFNSIYNGYNVTATDYIYTADSLSGAGDGWVSQRADEKILTIGVATLTASIISMRIEGRYPVHNRAFEIYSRNYTTITTIDESITITENCPQIRIGVKVNNSASPNNIYCGLCYTEFK